ncbi:MAG: peptidoglycan-binding domain-containing protein [Verrucomicrobiota bacterium]
MKHLPLLAIASSIAVLPQANARDSVSIGIGISSSRYYGPGYPRYSPPGYYSQHCPPYPIYTTPVYTPPPAPIYYAPPVAPIYPGQPVYTPLPPPVNLDVVRVQATLRQRKYYAGSVDGLNGPATQAAIRAYQLDRCLDVTGRIDAVLLADLGL